MTLFEEWTEARRLEASGAVGGTRSTYMEWLMERQVILLAALGRLRVGQPEEVEDVPEDPGSADSKRLAV